MRLPTHVTCPEGVTTSYLTPGKTYEITGWFDEPTGFYIEDDDGEVLYCRTERCAHLSLEDKLDWILMVNCKPVVAERPSLDEALDMLTRSRERLNDMLKGDDAQAWDEAREFVPTIEAFLAKHGREVQS